MIPSIDLVKRNLRFARSLLDLAYKANGFKRQALLHSASLQLSDGLLGDLLVESTALKLVSLPQSPFGLHGSAQSLPSLFDHVSTHWYGSQSLNTQGLELKYTSSWYAHLMAMAISQTYTPKAWCERGSAVDSAPQMIASTVSEKIQWVEAHWSLVDAKVIVDSIDAMLTLIDATDSMDAEF